MLLLKTLEKRQKNNKYFSETTQVDSLQLSVQSGQAELQQ